MCFERKTIMLFCNLLTKYRLVVTELPKETMVHNPTNIDYYCPIDYQLNNHVRRFLKTKTNMCKVLQCNATAKDFVVLMPCAVFFIYDIIHTFCCSIDIDMLIYLLLRFSIFSCE